MKAEYTLRQAVNMVEIICREYMEHRKLCEDCFASLAHKEMDDTRCDDGMKMLDNYLKWQRRVGYAAKREGVKAPARRTQK
jgi:hypothetical protein